MFVSLCGVNWYKPSGVWVGFTPVPQWWEKPQRQSKWPKYQVFSWRPAEREIESIRLSVTSSALCTVLQAHRQMCQMKYHLFAHCMTAKTNSWNRRQTDTNPTQKITVHVAPDQVWGLTEHAEKQLREKLESKWTQLSMRCFWPAAAFMRDPLTSLCWTWGSGGWLVSSVSGSIGGRCHLPKRSPAPPVITEALSFLFWRWQRKSIHTNMVVSLTTYYWSFHEHVCTFCLRAWHVLVRLHSLETQGTEFKSGSFLPGNDDDS